MSAFRPIAPSSSHEQPSVSASAPTDKTVPSAVIDSNISIGKARKRKAPAHVSQNACTNCKKARAKCDGEEPAACTRCISRSIDDSCHYEIHVKTAKEELIRRIKDLEAKNALLRGLVGEKDRWIECVLQVLRDDKAVSIVEQLKQGQNENDLISVLSRPPVPTRTDSASSAGSSRRFSSDANMSNAAADDEDLLVRWTSVTPDEALVHHLLALYFAWVHPMHMMFSERHFMTSFNGGNSRYCTPAMVNAMCALGCAYWADPEGGMAESKRLLDQFHHRARSEVESEDRVNPATPITYAILFLVELSRGEARNAASHLRVAVEALRTVDRQNWAEEAYEITLWGIHSLCSTWNAFCYQKPSDPLPARGRVFKDVELDTPDALWRDYRSTSETSNHGKPSYAITTAKEFAKLNQIIFETMNVYCGRRGRVTAESVLELYRRYLVWKDSLPKPLTNTHTEVLLPHAFALHIQYSVALAQLFAPLLEESSFPNMSRDHIRTLTTQSAREGLILYQRYRSIYTNRYPPPLLGFCLVHLGDMLLKYGDSSDLPTVTHFCLDSLREALPGFAYVGPLTAMFCESAVANGHPLPPEASQYLGGRNWRSFSREEKLDCCDRLTYAQPVQMLVERLDPNIGLSFEDEWKLFIESHGGDGSSGSGAADAESSSTEGPGSAGSPRDMHIQTLMNP